MRKEIMRVRIEGWFTLSGMPGSASMSDPSSDPPPSGLTAMMSKCERQKNLNRNQMNFGSKCKQHPPPHFPSISRRNIWEEQVEEVFEERGTRK